MDSKKRNESEIVDMACGHQPHDVAIDGNGDPSSAYGFWRQAADALESDRLDAAERNRALRASVLARVKAIQIGQTAAPRVRRRLRAVPMGLAAAACALMAVGYALVVVRTGGAHPSGPQTTAAAPMTAVPQTMQVAASTVNVSSGHGTLRRSIESAPAGATVKIASGSTSDTIRIAKPVILTAVGGPVQIGKAIQD